MNIEIKPIIDENGSISNEDFKVIQAGAKYINSLTKGRITISLKYFEPIIKR